MAAVTGFLGQAHLISLDFEGDHVGTWKSAPIIGLVVAQKAFRRVQGSRLRHKGD
jgi:hypothetical protein